MAGSSYCPHCKELNACGCKSCSETKSKRKKHTWTEDGECMICAYCGKKFHPDQALDMEFKMRNLSNDEFMIFNRMVRRGYPDDELCEIFFLDITNVEAIRKAINK